MCLNVKITASKSNSTKCERCWSYNKESGYNKYFEDNLCKRCVTILCELEEKGQWLKCPACLEWTFDENGIPENINDNYLCKTCMKEMTK